MRNEKAYYAPKPEPVKRGIPDYSNQTKLAGLNTTDALALANARADYLEGRLDGFNAQRERGDFDNAK